MRKFRPSRPDQSTRSYRCRKDQMPLECELKYMYVRISCFKYEILHPKMGVGAISYLEKYIRMAFSTPNFRFLDKILIYN